VKNEVENLPKSSTSASLARSECGDTFECHSPDMGFSMYRDILAQVPPSVEVAMVGGDYRKWNYQQSVSMI
jgi:hypothetical protein